MIRRDFLVGFSALLVAAGMAPQLLASTPEVVVAPVAEMTLSQAMQEYYDRRFLEYATQQMTYAKIVPPGDMEKTDGKRIKFFRYDNGLN